MLLLLSPSPLSFEAWFESKSLETKPSAVPAPILAQYELNAYLKSHQELGQKALLGQERTTDNYAELMLMLELCRFLCAERPPCL